MSETRFCLECDRKTESGESYGRAYCRECGSFYDDSEMNDREKKIAEIRKTLEKATPGPWKWIDPGGLERKKLVGDWEIMNFGIGGVYDQVAGSEPDEDDAHLIANAPEWLRFLLSEIEHLERDRAEERAAHNAHVTELCELEQERDMYKSSSEVFYERLKKEAEQREKLVERLRAELEKWEAEARLQYRLHNEMIEKERECREKLNQALEALEWIRDAGTDYQSINKARQALQSIRGDAP